MVIPVAQFKKRQVINDEQQPRDAEVALSRSLGTALNLAARFATFLQQLSKPQFVVAI